TSTACHDSPPTSIAPLSLHDALPILLLQNFRDRNPGVSRRLGAWRTRVDIEWLVAIRTPHAFELPGVCVIHRAVQTHVGCVWQRSEEHTSELQSPDQLVCRILLEKKK